MKNCLRLIYLLLALAGTLGLNAQTATQVVITGGSSAYSIGNNIATVVDPEISITANGNISGFTVTITGSYTTGDVLAYNGSLPSGITTSGFSTATRAIQFNGTASPTVWQEFLRRVTLRTTSAVCFPEQRQISFNFGSVYYNPLNDHFYTLSSGNSSWTNARNSAASSSYYGYQGYLATFTSAAENTFVSNFINANSWIGCSDNAGVVNSAVGFTKYANQTAAEGKFHWVTGPETGTQMRTGNASLGNLGSPIAGVYQNWSASEPNDYSSAGTVGQEDYGHAFSNGLWNDYPNGQSIKSIIEYGGMPNDIVNSTVVFTKTVGINGAPTTSISGGGISVCPGGSATLSLPSFSGTVVRWEYSVNNFLTAGVSLGNPSATLNLTNITETRYYRAIVNTSSPTCNNLSTSSTLVSVATAAPGNVIAQTSQVCAGGSATLSLFGNEGSVLDWQVDDDSGFSTPTTISQTSTTINYILASTGTYYFRARIQNGSCGSPIFSPSATVTVVAGGAPQGGSVSSASFCGGTNSGTLTLTGQTGTIVKWQRSNDLGVVWSDISNTSTSYSFSGITQTTLFRAVLTNGSCGQVNSSPGTVTVYSFSTSSNGPVCAGSTLELGVTTTGGDGPFTFAWTGPNSFSSALQNPTVSDLQSNGAGTYSVQIGAPGCSVNQTTSVTVNAAPTITATNGANLCAAGTATITASPSTGSVRWYTSSIGGSVVSTSNSYTTPVNNATTTYYVEAFNGTCASFPRQAVVVSVGSATTGTLTETACDSYSINGETFTETGIYTQNLTNAAGCDSTLTLDLTINNSSTETVTETACDSYSINGETFTETGVYTQNLTNAAGCDSTLTLDLTINNSSTETVTETACDSYSINGETFTETGIYTQNLTNAAGCDSTLTLDLTINSSSTGTVTETACDSYSINGETFTETGVYTQNLTNAAGCDSTLTLDLTINNSSTETVTETACDSYSINGETFTETGVYTQNLTNAAGCDSTLTLDLTINSSTTETVTETACDSYSINGETFTETGVYTQNLTNAAGCDSTLTLDLTINNSSTETVTETACDSYSINGETFTETGIYTQNLTNAAGCDSTLTLDLTINSSSTETVTETACDSYSINGETFTETGVYSQNLTNAAGCDSTLTLDLTINSSTTGTVTETACDSYSINGETFTETGVYTQNLTNAAGCDSTLMLDLTINNSSTETVTETACDSYSINGETFTEREVDIRMTNALLVRLWLRYASIYINNSSIKLVTENKAGLVFINRTFTETGIHSEFDSMQEVRFNANVI